MRETGVIFQGWGVRAILEDRKTMTRRTRGLELINENPDDWAFVGLENSLGYPASEGFLWAGFQHKDSASPIYFKCPYGGPSLWVRETWALARFSTDEYGNIDWVDEYTGRIPQDKPSYYDVVYDANMQDVENHPDDRIIKRWRPSIHMPRWASRLTLEIVSVRVERLKEITEEDAIKEGIFLWEHTSCGQAVENVCWAHYPHEPGLAGMNTPIGAFRSLWNFLRGPGAFERNDYVWRIEWPRYEGVK